MFSYLSDFSYSCISIAKKGECNLDLESFEDALICFKCALTLLRKGNTSNFELLDCYGRIFVCRFALCSCFFIKTYYAHKLKLM